MSEYIPIEIQAEILKRLPVKPLIQFRSVSKPWKSLIDSPDFIAAYCVRHPQPDDRFILRYTLLSHEFVEDIYLTHVVEDRYITLVDNDDHSFVQQDFVPTIPDLVKKIVPRFTRIVGSSHGLLCLRGYYPDDDDLSEHDRGEIEMVVLWNPSIRKSIGIQVPEMEYDFPNEKIQYITSYNVFGFGVCPATLDPTILKIKFIDYQRKMEDMHVISVPWKVQVYTLSTGAWSILSTHLPRESVRLTWDQVVIDRFIYWVAVDSLGAEDGQSRSKSNTLIVSFDLTTKEFKEINLSGSLSNPFCKIHSISKLRESLVVLAYHGSVGEGVFSLWMMMKEQGVNRSFTKLYNINTPVHTITQILGFRKTRELIMETQQQLNAEVQIYEPNSEAIYDLGIDGDSFFMCSYMETLFLLDQLDGFIYSISN